MQRQNLSRRAAAAGGRTFAADQLPCAPRHRQRRPRTPVVGSSKRPGWKCPRSATSTSPTCRPGWPPPLPGQGLPDYRQMLEDKSIGVVIVATPDHWHGVWPSTPSRPARTSTWKSPWRTPSKRASATSRPSGDQRVGADRSQRRSSALFIEAKRSWTPARSGEVRMSTPVDDHFPARALTPGVEGKLDWQAWLGPRHAARIRPPHGIPQLGWFSTTGGGYLAGQAVLVGDAINWMMIHHLSARVTSAGALRPERRRVPPTAAHDPGKPDYNRRLHA